MPQYIRAIVIRTARIIAAAVTVSARGDKCCVINVYLIKQMTVETLTMAQEKKH